MPLRICRFCFEETGDKLNPLLRPCKCKGSMAYVHKDCINRWRRLTTMPENMTNCQLCLTKFKLPILPPLEIILDELPDNLNLLSNPILLIVGTMFITNFYYVSLSFILEITLQSPQMFFPNSLKDQILAFGNAASVTTITIVYVRNYLPFYQIVYNKNLYLKHLLVVSYNPFECLLYRVLFMAFLYVYSTSYCNFLSSFVYVMLLPKLMNTHNQILTRINQEIF